MMGFDLRVKQGAFTDMKAVPLCRPDQDLGPGLIANAGVQLLGFDPFADSRRIADQVETSVAGETTGAFGVRLEGNIPAIENEGVRF